MTISGVSIIDKEKKYTKNSCYMQSEETYKSIIDLLREVSEDLRERQPDTEISAVRGKSVIGSFGM